MEPTPRELRVYETPQGVFPFDDWLDGIRDKRAYANIVARLARLEQGNFGLCKAVGEGVLELKIDFGPGYRVYFAEHGKSVVLLLVGGDKSTQPKNISTAKIYWKRYKEAQLDR